MRANSSPREQGRLPPRRKGVRARGAGEEAGANRGVSPVDKGLTYLDRVARIRGRRREMGILDDIRSQVNTIASEQGLPDFRAFAYWYLEGFEDLSHEEALETVVDGPWDGGRDAVYEDEDAGVLHIYQFKYSGNREYVLKGLSDLQRAVKEEREKLGRFLQVKLSLVTTLQADRDFFEEQKRVQKSIRAYLTNSGSTCSAEVEVVDLMRFAQLLDKIYGVNVRLQYNHQPIQIEDAVLGVVDVRPLRPSAESGVLFAFNIRNFLGVRKRSVNYEIKETLEDDDRRRQFWEMNNGIVCLCTAYRLRDDNSVDYDNLTVVNGAQTTSTIARFLEANPTVEDPVWVVAKIVKVNESDVDTATRLTKTSNRQTPASSKDLRAIDTLHRTVKQWFSERLGVVYVYRRGDRAPRAAPYVTMKEMAQAYIAFWQELPHVAFSRPGQIFGGEEYYDAVFPEDEIEMLKTTGSSEQTTDFLLRRLIPFRVLKGIRAVITQRVAAGEDKKMRSLAYHCVWAYKRMFEAEGIGPTISLLEQVDGLVAQTGPAVFDAMADFLRNPQVYDVPRVLKSASARDSLLQGEFLSNTRVRQARNALKEAVP
jgi:hypothetical protein